MVKSPNPDRPLLSPLARFANQLARRSWGAIVLELSLIVAGILIALSIDGWVQDREDRRVEAAYLRALASDVGQLVEQLKAYIDLESQTSHAGAAVLDTLSSNGYAQHEDSLRRQMSTMASRRIMRLVSAVYTDLTSTGNLRVTRGRDLREQLLRFFAKVHRVELVIQNNNTMFVDQLYFPFLLEAGITWLPTNLAAIDENLTEANRYLLELIGPDKKMPTDDVLAQPSDAEIWDQIRRMSILRTSVSAVGRALAVALIADAETLKAAIEQQYQ